MIFLTKIHLHVLGINKNINSKGTAHVQAPKQDCTNCTGSRMHVSRSVLYREMFVIFARAAGASEGNFSDSGDAHMEDCVHVGGVKEGPRGCV